jgi:hypothetical protein
VSGETVFMWASGGHFEECERTVGATLRTLLAVTGSAENDPERSFQERLTTMKSLLEGRKT